MSRCNSRAVVKKAREARELRKLRELSALKIQCYHRRARAIQLLLRMRRLAQAKAGPVVCDLAELETFFDEEPIIPVQVEDKFSKKIDFAQPSD